MVDNLKTSAVIKDKLSSAATNLMTSLDHTVQNMGRNKPSEDTPVNYKVTHKGGALVRSGCDTTSSQVHQLAAGEVVTIVELVGRRARIITPVEGWVSTETKDGVQIMRPCTMQRRSAQNEAFEHMFEQKFSRLKQQQGGTAGSDPRVEQSPYESPRSSRGDNSPRYDRGRNYSDDEYDRRDRGKGGGDRRGGGSAGGGATGEAGFVPRLAAPGQSKGPAFLPGPAKASSGSLLTDMGTSGSAPNIAGAQANKPAGGDNFDLLGVSDAQPAAPVQQASFDPFASTPAGASAGFAPAVGTPHPAQAPTAPAADDWASFQSGGGCMGGAGAVAGAYGGPGIFSQGGFAAGTSMGGVAQTAFNPGSMPQQHAGHMHMAATPMQMPQQMSAQVSGGFGMQSAAGQPMANPMGMGVMGAGMGMGVGQMSMPMASQQQMSRMGQMAQMSQNPTMGMNMGQMGQTFPQSSFGGQQAAPMTNGGSFQVPPQQAYRAPAQQSAAGFTMAGQGSPALNNVDDLMSRAMEGMSNMSFEQRRAAAQSQPASSNTGGNMPMGMMMQNMMR